MSWNKFNFKSISRSWHDSIGHLKKQALHERFIAEQWHGVWMEMLQLTTHSVLKKRLVFDHESSLTALKSDSSSKAMGDGTYICMVLQTHLRIIQGRHHNCILSYRHTCNYQNYSRKSRFHKCWFQSSTRWCLQNKKWHIMAQNIIMSEHQAANLLMFQDIFNFSTYFLPFFSNLPVFCRFPVY